jgi:hypothetical protein
MLQKTPESIKEITGLKPGNSTVGLNSAKVKGLGKIQEKLKTVINKFKIGYP